MKIIADSFNHSIFSFNHSFSTLTPLQKTIGVVVTVASLAFIAFMSFYLNRKFDAYDRFINYLNPTRVVDPNRGVFKLAGNIKDGKINGPGNLENKDGWKIHGNLVNNQFKTIDKIVSPKGVVIEGPFE